GCRSAPTAPARASSSTCRATGRAATAAPPAATATPRRPTAPAGGDPSAGRLGEGEEVALAVEEERAPLAGALARVVVGRGDDVVLGPEAGDVEALEPHAAGAQLGDRLGEILHLEAHLRRGARGRPGRGEDVELRRAAHVAQPAPAFLDRLEPEPVAVEAPGPIQVLGGELGDRVCRVERPGHGRAPSSSGRTR